MSSCCSIFGCQIVCHSLRAFIWCYWMFCWKNVQCIRHALQLTNSKRIGCGRRAYGTKRRQYVAVHNAQFWHFAANTKCRILFRDEDNKCIRQSNKLRECILRHTLVDWKLCKCLCAATDGSAMAKSMDGENAWIIAISDGVVCNNRTLLLQLLAADFARNCKCLLRCARNSISVEFVYGSVAFNAAPDVFGAWGKWHKSRY